MKRNHDYYVYIMTNKRKSVLYVGVTNNLNRRVMEHKSGLNKGFTSRYSCFYLIYYEYFTNILVAIKREKEIKKWRREKKERLINTLNPDWNFLDFKRPLKQQARR